MHAFDLDLFKTALRATSQIEGLHLICNFSRTMLNQTGSGHFSPVGGYNEQEQKVLLLDTARFKYPPHWVDIEMLYQAICTVDTETDTPRGFVLLTRKTS